MNWEVFVGIGIPVVAAVVLLVHKLTKIDTKLGFLQKTVDNLVVRVDGIDNKLISVEKVSVQTPS
jgi:hypothetical protein